MPASNRIGKQTLVFPKKPFIISSASIVGDVEGKGPLGNYFDIVLEDDTWGEKSWEKSESKMFEQVVRNALKKALIADETVQCLFGGDLLNQIISANYAARSLKIPFIGLYGACSTMSESLLLGSMAIDGGYVNCAACVTGSHFSTAERQFRMPLEMGSPSTPTSQRTVTGSACIILSEDINITSNAGSNISLGKNEQDTAIQKVPIRITHGTIGKVIDLGVTDASNMGAAMVPAAAATIETHLKDTSRTTDDYDLIVTGDLGKLGAELLSELCCEKGIDLSGKLFDCGCAIYSDKQKVYSGGSGCGCSAVTLAGYLLKKILEGNYNRILFMATGALMNTGILQQGESIPGVAHAVVIERG